MTLPLSEIKRLMEKATPEPWASPRGECDTFGDCPLQLSCTYEGWRDDADLIVAMRNAMPAIIERMEKLEAVANAARNIIECRSKQAELKDAISALDKDAGK